MPIWTPPPDPFRAIRHAMRVAALREFSSDSSPASTTSAAEIDAVIPQEIHPDERQRLLDRLWRDACDQAELAATVAELLKVGRHHQPTTTLPDVATPVDTQPAKRRPVPTTPPSISDLLEGMLGGSGSPRR